MEFGEPLHMAFVDLHKAYDSVPCDLLWCILHIHGVHKKLVELLEELHRGSQAAVRMKGQKFEWFDVRREGGVRQGFVIGPLFNNTYMDIVAEPALAQMSDGCGVEHAYCAVGSCRAWIAVMVLLAWS
jgi:hypothetical protein